MKLAAITRLKHGGLVQALRAAGWSQSELARRSGISQPKISAFVLLKTKPTEEDADSIQRAFGEAGVYLDVLDAWPESFKGFPHALILEQFQDVDANRFLLGSTGTLAAPQLMDIEETKDSYTHRFRQLPERTQQIILEKDSGLSYRAIGRKHNISGSHAQQLYASGQRKIRTGMCKDLTGSKWGSFDPV